MTYVPIFFSVPLSGSGRTPRTRLGEQRKIRSARGERGMAGARMPRRTPRSTSDRAWTCRTRHDDGAMRLPSGLDEPARQANAARWPRDLRRERAERGAEGEQAGHHGHAQADQSRRAQGERLKRFGEFEEGKWYRSASGGWAATFTVFAPSCVTRIGWSVYNPFSHAGSRGVERSGETYVGDDADDGADKTARTGLRTRGADAPDDQAREHGVSGA